MTNNYANSQVRYDALRKIVIAGKDAKAVLKYAEQFEEIIRGLVLKTALENKNALEDNAQYYRVAHDFCNLLRTAVELGNQKAKTMDKMREEAKKQQEH